MLLKKFFLIFHYSAAVKIVVHLFSDSYLMRTFSVTSFLLPLWHHFQSFSEEDIIIIIPLIKKIHFDYKNRFLPFLPTFISISIFLITYRFVCVLARILVVSGISFPPFNLFYHSFIHPSTSNSLPSTLHPQNRHTKIKGKRNHCCIFFCFFLFLFLVNFRRSIEKVWERERNKGIRVKKNLCRTFFCGEVSISPPTVVNSNRLIFILRFFA